MYRRHEVGTLLGLAIQEAVSRRLCYWLAHNPSREGVFSIVERELESDGGEQEMTVPVFEWQSYQSHPLPQKDLSKTKQQARFLSVELSGELQVHDPERFVAMLSTGIGAAKAFGCGLMLIRPV